MKVLHWYPNFLGGGGVANAVLGLARAQADLGAEVIIASAEPQGPPLYHSMEEALGKVQLFRWQPQKTFHFGGLVWRVLPNRIREQLKGLHPDIVHIHGEFNPDNFYASYLFNAPLVLSPHGAFHPVTLKKSKQKQKKLYIEIAKRLLYKYVRAFHGLTPAEANHISSLLGRVNIYIAPNGANPNLSLANKNASKNKIGEGKEEISFIFVGRLSIYHKGLDILLESFAAILEEFPEKKLTLTLVGPDWHGSKKLLKQIAATKHCLDRVIFTGALPSHEVAEKVANSDFYIQLSRYEGASLSIIESLLFGKPAILSDQTGVVSYENIRSLPSIKIIPPEKHIAIQAMKEFIQRRDELKAMAEHHRDRIRAFFDWRRIAQEHLAWYEKISG